VADILNSNVLPNVFVEKVPAVEVINVVVMGAIGASSLPVIVSPMMNV